MRVPLIVKAITIENDLRATLRNFGLKVGMIGTVKFETRIRALVSARGSASRARCHRLRGRDLTAWRLGSVAPSGEL